MFNILFLAEELHERWEKLFARFKKELSDKKKPLPSGSGAKAPRKWIYFDSMQMYSSYLEPRSIQSSLGTSKKIVPESDEYSRKRKANMDDIDKELMETTSMLKKNLELSLMSNSSQAAEDTGTDDPYCEAVIKFFMI